MSKETITLPADMVGQRLDTILAGVLADVSRAQIQAWIKEGRITDSVTGKPIFQSSLKSKTPLTVIIDRPNKKPFEPPRAEDKPDNLHIVFEDDYLLIINKPSGIAVHPGAGRPGGTLVNMLLGHTELSDMGDQERPGIVHRLDKDTSGLMVVAKTNAVHAKLADALQNRDVKRVYNALVWNVPRPLSDTIETQIGRDPKARRRKRPDQREPHERWYPDLHDRRHRSHRRDRRGRRQDADGPPPVRRRDPATHLPNSRHDRHHSDQCQRERREPEYLRA